MPKIQLIRNSTAIQNSLSITSSLIPSDLKPNEIKVKIVSTTTLFYDKKVIEGTTAETFPIGYELGTSAAGIITDLSANLSGYEIGDKILILRHPRFQGLWKKEAVVPLSCICPAPQSADLVDCSALAYVGNLAMNALFEKLDKCAISQGDSVVIIGTLNTVCYYIAQLALYCGARSVTIVTQETSSTEKFLELDPRIKISHIGVELFTKFDYMVALDTEWHSYLGNLAENSFVAVFSSPPPLNVIERLTTNKIRWEYKNVLPRADFMEFFVQLFDEKKIDFAMQAKKIEFSLKGVIESLQQLRRNVFLGEFILFNK